MNKVYSLDTYRKIRTKMSKTEALNSIVLDSQEDLDVHFENIEHLKNEPAEKYMSIFNRDLYQDDIS